MPEYLEHGTVKKDVNMMKPFNFLIGDWELEYKIPKSKYSEAMTGSGKGTCSRKLDDKYVFFDYKARVGDSPEGQAHAVFAWDAKIDLYRFWWCSKAPAVL